MRIFFYSLFLIGILAFASCKKSDSTPTTNNGGQFAFSSLVAADTVLKVNAITTVTASATGNGLTYHWTASYGTFIGSGAAVRWTVCHADTFTVTCEVTDDSGHSDSKTVNIHVRD